MAKNVNSIELSAALSKDKSFQKKLRNLAEIKLQKNKDILIQDFEKHPVSKEIAAGPDAGNISGTLGGYGNLFSFIGFSNGTSPVSQWIQLLQNKIKIISDTPTKRINGDEVVLSFKVSSVGKQDLDSAKMPWEGRSWITAIERGISGFSFYISKAMGRSGGGIQSNHNVRNSRYAPVSYWSEMWLRFIKNLTS